MSTTTMKFIGNITLLLSAILLAGCSGGSGGSTSGPAAELREARKTWESAGVENYTFQFRWQCFCMVEYVSLVELRVEGGKIVRGTYVESGDTLGPERLADYVPVEELFDIIEEAIERDAHSIRAEYDPDLGYPVDVYIDYEEMAADEERGYAIEKFVR